MSKIHYVKKYHRGRQTIIKGTLEGLINYFRYTLECGHSWNNKISENPKTIKSFITNVNKSFDETQGGCFERDYIESATEDDYVNAEALGHRTSEAD
jgi:hypothetical protein